MLYFLYLGSVSKFSVRLTLFLRKPSKRFVRMMPLSKIFLVCRSIKLPVLLSMLNPRKVILCPSGLKKRYGCGLEKTSIEYDIPVFNTYMYTLYSTRIQNTIKSSKRLCLFSVFIFPCHPFVILHSPLISWFRGFWFSTILALKLTVVFDTHV